MKQLLIATSNKHKIEEFKQMLQPLGYEVLSLLDIEEKFNIIEDGTTFAQNALIKVRTIYDKLHIPVCSDDSGLMVNALNGAPGVYSARFLGEDTSYDVKNQYIIDQVKDSDDKGAQFVCVIAYKDQEGKEFVFEGVVEGEIYHEQLGSNGFGYDPIFYYPPYQTTTANVSSEMKNAISHRGRALNKFLEHLKGE